MIQPILKDIIEVLRRPAHPNAFYHLVCYQASSRELLVGILQLREEHTCTACGGFLSQPPRQKDAPTQQSLWEK